MLNNWLKKNKMTAKALAKKLGLPYYQVLQVKSKTSKNLKAISLIYAFTQIPLYRLLPTSLRDTSKKMKEFSQKRPTRELAKAKRKIYTIGNEWPVGSLFEITWEDFEIIRLEKNEEIIHLPIDTFNRFFRRLELDVKASLL